MEKTKSGKGGPYRVTYKDWGVHHEEPDAVEYDFGKPVLSGNPPKGFRGGEIHWFNAIGTIFDDWKNKYPRPEGRGILC